MRVLDLGCGPGRDLSSWGVTRLDEITGLDIDRTSLSLAKARFSDRTFVQASGESLPFKDESFDRVISAIALPYMNIPKALREAHRVLVPRGRLSLSLHLPSFTVTELVHKAIPKPIPTIFRLYVIANGLWFHCTGSTIPFASRRTESFQTHRGMRIALARAGFVDFSVRYGSGPAGKTFLLDAIKSERQDSSAAMGTV